MVHFGRVVSEALGWPLFVDEPVPECDQVLVVGMYDPPLYEHTLAATSAAKRRVIEWCGADASMLVRPELLPEAVHLVAGEMLADLLRNQGLESTEVMVPTTHHFPVTPLPEQPCVSCYLGALPERYGATLIRQLQGVLPQARFITYQLGQHGHDELAEIMRLTTVSVQVGSGADNGGTSSREAMEAGRTAVSTVGFPFIKRVSSASFVSIVSAVKESLARTEPDLEAADYWRERNSVDYFKQQLRRVGVLDG